MLSRQHCVYSLINDDLKCHAQKKQKKKKHTHIYINILLCEYIWDLITSGNINNPSGAFFRLAQFMTSEQAEWAAEEENVENMECSRPLHCDND